MSGFDDFPKTIVAEEPKPGLDQSWIPIVEDAFRRDPLVRMPARSELNVPNDPWAHVLDGIELEDIDDRVPGKTRTETLVLQLAVGLLTLGIWCFVLVLAIRGRS